MGLENYISKKSVPNEIKPGTSILFVGDFPSEDDLSNGSLISGRAGEKFDTILSACGLTRSQVSIANICQYRPANDDFTYLEDSEQLQEGVAVVRNLLPNFPCIFAFGEYPLQYIFRRSGISDWRSSPLKWDKSFILPTYHPKTSLYNPTVYPLIIFDIQKGLRLQKSYREEIYDFNLNPRGIALEQAVEEICNHSGPISLDIETRKKEPTSIRCVGFGLGPSKAIVLANNGMLLQGDTHFQNALDRIFQVKKSFIFQNGIFDREALRLFGAYELHTEDDTNLAEHILNPELPRDLGFLTQTYTDIPCYWSDISFDADAKSSSDKTPLDKLLTYNALDCIVTYRIIMEQKKELEKNPTLLKLYKYELEMTDISLHMSKAGFKVDTQRLSEIKAIIDKRNEYAKTIMYMLNGNKLINIASPKQVAELLYDKLKLPVQRKKKGGVTTDDAALVKLIGYCAGKLSSYVTEAKKSEWRTKLAILKTIQNIRGYDKLISSYLDISISPDGRVRSTWKVAGTETGRWSCGLYIDGTGLNAQTFPRTVIEDE